MFPGKQGIPTGNNNNNNNHNNSTTSGTEGCLALLLGEQMASSPLLLAFLLVAIADCLAFTGVFIPYTYLPSAASSAVPIASASFGASLISLIGVND